MLNYPHINPVAFHLLKWPIYWYGLMYLFGFMSAWVLLSHRLKYYRSTPIASPCVLDNAEQLSDLLFYAGLGIILGGRIGYMLFYHFDLLFSQPLLLFQTWKGGMSFHGGLLGVLFALFLYARKMKKSFFALTDFVAPVVPIGLGAGRIGNFINGELWGRVTHMPWGMIFPTAGPEWRHPSQLYEAGLEGLLLFFILWIYSRRPRPTGAISAYFAILYGFFRSIGECFREPDAQVGYLAGGLTEGQYLSLPLIIIGSLLLIYAYQKRNL